MPMWHYWNFAGKAETNAAQATFFEAMQELKRKRTEVEQWFFKSVDTGFKNFINGTASSESMPAGFGDVRVQLSLVDKNDVEAALPMQNMIAKANANYSEQLYGLNQRLAVVNGGTRLPKATLPGGPMSVGRGRAHCASVCWTWTPRHAWWSMWCSSAMSCVNSTGMYEEYNRRLINAGILPNLSYEIRKQHDPRPVKPGTSGAAGTSGTSGRSRPQRLKACRADYR